MNFVDRCSFRICKNFLPIYITVKPAPVSSLTVKKTERSSVAMVTWKFPAKLPPLLNMTYTISLKTEEGWDDRSLVRNGSNPQAKFHYFSQAYVASQAGVSLT